ncbi:hypothetical protein TURU_133241 [Turdus rufiventris]|nr:hypothetical protein TURU_133241 [Turdus rufiventris]
MQTKLGKSISIALDGPAAAAWLLHKDFVFQDSVVAAVSISPVLASAEQTKQIQQIGENLDGNAFEQSNLSQYKYQQIGQEMLENLSHDREKIQRARERLREADANLGKSSRILTGMLRRSTVQLVHHGGYRTLLSCYLTTISAHGEFQTTVQCSWQQVLERSPGLRQQGKLSSPKELGLRALHPRGAVKPPSPYVTMDEIERDHLRFIPGVFTSESKQEKAPGSTKLGWRC